ncbi:MAG: HAMP domain-containing sensor histidine kinase [Verrucomicrobiota bacterium]
MRKPLSLKSNILILNALILGSVLALLGTTFYFYEYQKRLSVIDVSLDQLVTPLRGEFSRPPGATDSDARRPSSRERPDPSYFSAGLEGSDWTRREDDLFGGPSKGPSGEGYGVKFDSEHVPRGFYATVAERNSGDVVFRSRNFPDIEIPKGTYQGFFFRFREDGYREVLNGDRRVNVLIGLDLSDFRSGLNLLKLQIFAVSFIIFLLSLGFWFVFVSRRLKPLKSIQETAVKIAEGELSERIDSKQEGCAQEFDILIRELNHSFSQLDALFQRQLRFTADASHELKTPLTVLIAHIDLALRGTRNPEEYLAMLRICSQSCGRLNRIIQELLEISRYDAGSVELDYETLPLDEVITGLVEEMKAYAQQKESTVETDLESGQVEMDPFRLEQVLTNLINNALQHNERPVAIKVRSRIVGKDAVIEVIDNGKGIQPENIDKLFDRFFQEDTSRAQKQEGQNTGLGMAICKAIIDLHGGTIQVRSRPEVETVVAVKIPAAQSERI